VTEDDDILAAEYALGLLDAAEALAVQARARTDGPLSLRIAWWRDQLAPLAGEVATPAPVGVWNKIEAKLPGNDNSATLMQRWRAAAVAAMSVAAALLVFIAMQPEPVVITPAAPMMAALVGEKGAVIAVSYDVTSGKLMVAPTTLDPGKGDAELWIIPDGGTPRSLGVVNAKLTEAHMVPDADRVLVQPGATFAITQEVKGGSPSGQPAGPVVAAGKIIRT
jgi:anti-sigma-K factor RskA